MTTLSDLTRHTARLLTRTVIGAATSAGTTTTLIDTNNLATFPDDQFNGGTIWLTSGVNAGLTRALTDFVAASKQLTFAAFPSAVASSDKYECVDANLFTYSDLKQAVNLALREIGMILGKDQSLLADGNFAYTLPANVNNVLAVELVTNIDTTSEQASPSNHWEERDGKLVFEQTQNNHTLRLWYEKPHAQLVNDTDALDMSVDEIHFVYLAARQALRLAYKRYGKQKEDLPEWLSEAVAEAMRRVKRNRKPLVKIKSA